jgi:hypothetical protein
MKPWFIQEDNVIPFPKKDSSVVRLPNVNAYPDFLSGVQDLQNHLKQGDISSDIHKKLYQDLIHRFMKVESFETPWFLREAPAVDDQALGKDRAQKLNRIVTKLKSDPEFIDQIFNTLSQKAKDDQGQFTNRFIQMINPDLTKPEKDQSFGGMLKSVAAIISETEGTNEEKFQFASTLGKISHIDTAKLLQPMANWDDWLTSTPYSKRLFERCFNDPRLKIGNKGPGEAALALLSPQIMLNQGAGDITIDNQKIEVKGGETVSGGRLSPTENIVGQLDSKWIRTNIFANDKKAIIPAAVSHLKFVNQLVMPNNMTADQINKLLSNIFKRPELTSEIETLSKKINKIMPSDLFKLSLLNYAYSQGEVAFLILTRNVRKSIYFTTNNWQDVYRNMGISLTLYGGDKRSVGLAQLGINKKTN